MPWRAPVQDVGEVVAELKWWLDCFDEADRMARDMPPTIARAVDAAAGPHEIPQSILGCSTLSTDTRRWIMGTLERAVLLLREYEGLEAKPGDGPAPESRPTLRAVPCAEPAAVGQS